MQERQAPPMSSWQRPIYSNNNIPWGPFIQMKPWLFFEGMMIGCSDVCLFFFGRKEAFPSDVHLALGLPELPKSNGEAEIYVF